MSGLGRCDRPVCNGHCFASPQANTVRVRRESHMSTTKHI
jgi:hypothetical protein